MPLFALQHKVAASRLILGKKGSLGAEKVIFHSQPLHPVFLSVFEQVFWACSPHNSSSAQSGCELVFLGRGYVLAVRREVVGINGGLIRGLTKLATIKSLPSSLMSG